MIRKLSIKGLLVIATLLCSARTWAYDIAVENDDGVTIYYNIINAEDKTCEVAKASYSGKVAIPSTFKYDNTTYVVTSIVDEAFYSCSNLTSVTIGAFVEKIGAYTFYMCKKLEEVTIPNSVTSIGRYAFMNIAQALKQ